MGIRLLGAREIIRHIIIRGHANNSMNHTGLCHFVVSCTNLENAGLCLKVYIYDTG